MDTDGYVDNTFIQGTGFDNIIRGLALQDDGKILVVGHFNLYNGVAKNYIARLNGAALGVADFNHETKINAYPNPANDHLRFSLPDGVDVSGFKVYDVLGKIMDSGTLSENVIDLQGYVGGVYFLHLETDKGVLVSKFIKV